MRRFYRLTNLDNTGGYRLPRSEYAETLEVPSRTAMLAGIGEDGSFDVHGDLQSPLGEGSAKLGFTLIADCAANLQAQIDELLVGVYGATRDVGKRKLWRWEEGDRSARRWTFARPAARPSIPRDPLNERHVAVSANLLLPEPLFYDALTQKWLTDNGYIPLERDPSGEPTDPDNWFASFTVVTSPRTFSIENIGNVESRRVIFRLESLAVNGFTDPTITNSTTGQSFSTTRDGTTALHVLSFNAAPGLGRVQLSVNSGVTWVDDTLLLSLPAGQPVMMELAPGVNQFSIASGGTPNYRLLVLWLHGFRD